MKRGNSCVTQLDRNKDVHHHQRRKDVQKNQLPNEFPILSSLFGFNPPCNFSPFKDHLTALQNCKKILSTPIVIIAMETKNREKYDSPLEVWEMAAIRAMVDSCCMSIELSSEFFLRIQATPQPSSSFT